MSVLYITAPDEQTGVIAAITDDPCPCGWPETIVHVHPDGRMMRGCASPDARLNVLHSRHAVEVYLPPDTRPVAS